MAAFPIKALIMYFLPIDYQEPVFRPPSEAFSLILQVTLGCSWNRCAFCEMYSTKKFRVRSEKEIINDIKAVARINSGIKKVFIADGDPMVLPTNKLLKILHTLNKSFPDIRRISIYANARNILTKSDNELNALREKGLKLIYLGIESGDNEVLRMISKGETSETIVEGLQKARKAGIKCSVMILNGLGGKKFSEQHAVNSAEVLNLTQPEYASVLVLSFPLGIKRYIDRFNGEYIEMSKKDLLMEMRQMIENTNLDQTVFRSDHASNYLVLKGNLNRDKQKFLDNIDYAVNHPGILREDWQRGL